MKNYDEIIKSITSGANFNVDFKLKQLKIRGKVIEDLDYDSVEKFENIKDWLCKLEDLYYDYYNSIPTSNSKRRKQYFKAKRIDEIDMDGMKSPLYREEARARLEIFILFSLLNGTFSYDKILEIKENKDDWYYQSPIQKDLIINKYWF